MISRCCFVKGADDEVVERHGDLRERIGRLARSCEINRVEDRRQRSTFKRGPVDFDVFLELRFDSLYDMDQALEPKAGGLADQDAQLGQSRWDLVLVKKLDREVPRHLQNNQLIKRVSFLRRLPDVTAETFHSEWWQTHSGLVRKIPGYIGYAQNLVIDRMSNGRSVSDQAIPVDGMVEFWFEDFDGFNTCYA